MMSVVILSVIMPSVDILSAIMPSVVLLSVIMLSVVILSVVLLNVVALLKRPVVEATSSFVTPALFPLIFDASNLQCKRRICRLPDSISKERKISGQRPSIPAKRFSKSFFKNFFKNHLNSQLLSGRTLDL